MPKILGLVWNPIVQGKRLHEQMGWVNPDAELHNAVYALNIACGNLYTIAVEELPLLAHTRKTFGSMSLPEFDGIPHDYPADTWYNFFKAFSSNFHAWPNGGQLHVGKLLERSNLVARINSGAIDEVWLASPPVPAPFEGCMLHPIGDTTAYTTHDTMIAVPGLQRRCILHHFQVENWNAIHNYWHRVEAVLAHIWHRHVLGYCDWDFGGMSMQDVHTYAQLFTMTDLCRPGEAQVGSCHFMPNSKLGYVGDMDDAVPSGHHLWFEFPRGFPLDLSRKDRYDIVSGGTWANYAGLSGSVSEYIWQLNHIPKGQRNWSEAPALFANRHTDWWKYIVDVNDETGYGSDSPRPTVGQEPPYPLPVTKYGDKYIMRIAPHDSDPVGSIYKIYADGVLTDEVKYRAPQHTRPSLVTVAAKVWRVEGPGWSVDHVGQGVEDIPVQSPRFTPEQLMARLDQVHGPGGALVGCPKPNRWAWSSNQDILVFWDGLEAQPISSIVDDELTLDQAVGNYTLIYQLGAMKKFCGVTPTPIPTPVPTPTPTPVPTPTPPTDAQTAFNKWRDARVLERKLWDEYVKLLP